MKVSSVVVYSRWTISTKQDIRIGSFASGVASSEGLALEESRPCIEGKTHGTNKELEKTKKRGGMARDAPVEL